MASRKPWLTFLLLCLAVTLFGLIYPNYIINPMSHQNAGELSAAIAVLRYRGIADILCAAAAIAILIPFFRTKPRTAKTIAALTTVLAIFVSAAVSRINVFERMFHPLTTPAFHPVQETKLDADEKVMAIEINNQPRAYPIRIVSYHHVVNDVVGGVPIVATY